MSKPNKIGVCIYCGAVGVKLTDEHIVPYAFGNVTGDILHEASCEPCASITSSFELTMLRENFLPIRSVLQMPSRGRKKYNSLKQKVKYNNGEMGEIDVPYDKYLGQFGLPIFEPPTYFNGNLNAELLTITDIQTFILGSLSNKQWYEDQNIDEHYIHIIKSNKNQAFARFIMKIAYCAAVKFEGYEAVKTSPVRDIILGKDNHFAAYMGNLDDNQFTGDADSSSIARYAVASIEGSAKKLVAVQFFPFFKQSPIYHVVV